MRLVLTRPRPESEALARALAALGHRSLIEPMLEIVPTGAPVELAGVAALIATSANGARAFAAASPRRDLPLYAVGDATADAAREAGFASVLSAKGDVGDLARLIAAGFDPKAGALLHFAGQDVAGDLTGALAGHDLRRVVLYDARAATTLSAAYRAERPAPEGVLFFSPRSAATFVTLLDDAGLSETAAAMTAFCLSPAVAEAARPLAWRDVRIAARPDQAALLALLPAP